MRRALVIVAALLAGAAPASAQSPAQSPYGAEARAGYVDRVLDALRSSPPEAIDRLERALHLGARKRCRAAFGAPTAGCMVEMARAVCAERPKGERARCLLIADVVVTNMLAERDWVDEPTRLRLIGEAADYRAALAVELGARYATLVTELALSPGFRGGDRLGASIDGFCADHTRERALTYQRCVSAIAWYIGTGE